MDPPLLPCQPMETVPSASPPGPSPSAGPAGAIPTLTQLRVLLPYWLGSLYECPSLPVQHPLVVLSGVGESAVATVCRWSVLGAVLKSHGTRDMAVATHLVQAVTLLAESITASSSGWSSTERAACVRSGVLEALLSLWGSVLPQPQPLQPPSPPQSLEQLQALADDGFRRTLLQCSIQALIAVVPALGAPVSAPSAPLLVPQADHSLLHSPRTSAPAAALPAPLLDWCGRVCGVALQCLANSCASSPPAIPSGAPSSPQASVLRPPVALAHLMLLPGAGLEQSWMRESACVSGGCLVLLTLLWGAIKATDKPGPHTVSYHQALPLVLTAMDKHSWHNGVQLHGFDALGCLLLPPPSIPHSGVVSVGSEASAVVAAVLRVAPLLLPSPYYCARMCTLLQAMLPQILNSDDEDVDESAMQLSLSESEHSPTDPLQPHDRQQLLATAVQAIFQALRAHPKSLELCRAGWGVLGVVLPQCPQCPVLPPQGVKQMCSAMARLVVLALVAFPRQSDVVDACLHTFASALGQWGVAALRGLGVPVLSAVRQALGPSLPRPDKDKDKEPLYMTALLALTALLLRGDGALLRYVCGLRGNGQEGQGGAGLWPAHVLALALTSPSTPHMLLPDVCQALGVLCRAKDVGLLVLEAGACEAVAALLLKTHTQLQDLLAEQSQQHDQTENENDVGALRGLCVCASECLRALFSVDGDVSTSRLHDRHLAHAFPLALPYLNPPTATPPSSPPLTPSSSSPSSRLIITSAPRRLPLSPAPSAPPARVPISRPPPRVLSSTGLDPLLEALLARPTTAARQRQQLLQLTRALQHEPHRRRCLFKSGAVRGVMGALEAHPHHLALQQAGLQALAALLHTPTEAMAVLQQEGQALATLLANGIAGLASPMPPHATASLMCAQPGDTEADELLHTAWGHEEEGGRHRRGRLGVGRAALEVVMALMAQQEEEARQRLVQGGVGRTVHHTMTHLQHQRHHSSQDKEEEAKVLELLQRVSMLLSPPVSSGLVVVLDEEEEEEGGGEDWSGLQTLLKASTQVLDLMEQCKQHTATGGHSRRRARWDLRKRKKTRTTPA